MFDDDRCCPFTQIMHEAPSCCYVVPVEIRHGQAKMLQDVILPCVLPDLTIASALLMRILAVAKLFAGALQRQMNRRWQYCGIGISLIEPSRDRGVVGRNVSEGGA